MTHLAAGPGLLLAVKMQCAPLGEALPGVVFGPDDVFHHRIGMAAGVTQRPAGHRADMLFELGALAGLDGTMPGIVDAWSDLVDQKCAVTAYEQFHRQHA